MENTRLRLNDCGTWGTLGELAGIGALPMVSRKWEPGFIELVFSRRNVDKDMPLVDQNAGFLFRSQHMWPSEPEVAVP